MPTRNINSDLKVNADLTLPNLPTYSGSEVTTLMIAGADVVGKRDLGTNAFNSTSFLPLAGGTLTGDLNLTYAYPRINLTDTNHNSDYSIINNDGIFSIYDITNNSHRLSISAAGNATFAGRVGIGTTSPATPLDVAGILRLTESSNTVFYGGSYVRVFGDQHYGFRDSGGTYKAQISMSGNSYFNGGNVGIGTTNPYAYDTTATRLHVKNAGSSGSISEVARLEGASDADGSGAILRIGTSNDRGIYLEGGRTGTVPYGSIGTTEYNGAKTEAIRITSSGNVGIGTTSPSRKLVVAGQIGLSGTNTYIYGGDDEILAGQDGNGYYFATGNGQNVNKPVNIGDNNSYIRFKSGDAERMRITSGGNVGIGTTNPSHLLHVYAADGVAVDSYISLVQNAEATAGDNFGLKVQAGRNSSDVTMEVSNAVGTSYMRVRGDGNVGIGTTSPAKQLHVRGSAPFIRIEENSASNKRLDLWVDPSTAIGYIGANQSAQQLSFQTANTDRIRILNNGNVGIGTTSPAQKLDVNGNIIAARFIQDATAGNNFYAAGFTRSSSSLTSPDIYDLNGHGLVLGGTSNESTLVLKSGGNVGIGTNSPSHKLDIYSNENVPLRIHRPSNANLNSSGAWGIGFSTRGDAITSTTDTRAGIFSYYNGNLFLATNSTSIVSDPDAYARLTVTAAGNVGIGTTSPAQKLHVNGNVDIDNGGILLQRGYGINLGLSGYDIWMPTTTRVGIQTAATERLSILNNGKVGIGTTSPIAKFEVTDGSSSITLQEYSNGAAIFLDGVDGDFTGGDYFHILANSNSYLGLGGYGGGTTPLNISNAGNVGIGTTSPSSKLHVAGQIMISPSSGTPSLKFQDSGTTNAYIDLTDGQQRFDFRDDSDTVMSVTLDTLRVGIGTTSPTDKLEVQDGNIRIQTISNTDAKLILNPYSGTIGTGYQWELVGTNAANNYNFQIRENGTPYLTIENSVNGNTGNVGIGTTSPSQKLDVVGNVEANTTNANFRALSGSVITKLQSQTSGATQGVIGTESANNLAIVTSNQTRMFVNTSGNVGIGTTNPAYKLSVSSAYQSVNTDLISITDTATIYRGTPDGVGYEHAKVFSGRDATVYSYGSFLSFYTEGKNSGTTDISTERMRIDSSGNVGIGTTSPDKKLQISESNTSTSDTSGLKITNASVTSNTNAGILFENYDNNGAWIRSIRTGTSNGKLSFGTNSGAGIAESNISERMVIDHNGNVGIGTTSPSQKLHIHNGGIYATPVAYSGGADEWLLKTGASNNSGWDHGGIKVRVTSGGQPRLSLMSFGSAETLSLYAGKVGIGTTSPSTTLDVNGITTSDAFRTDTSNTDYNVISRNSTSTTLWVQAAQSGSIQGIASFRYGSATVNQGTEVCAIRRNSSYFINTKLGVGTNNPATTLDVEGTIKHKVYTVSTLPSASPAGQRAFVSDSSYSVSQAHGLVTAGSGSNFCPMYSDGTNWRVG